MARHHGGRPAQVLAYAESAALSTVTLASRRHRTGGSRMTSADVARVAAIWRVRDTRQPNTSQLTLGERSRHSDLDQGPVVWDREDQPSEPCREHPLESGADICVAALQTFALRLMSVRLWLRA